MNVFKIMFIFILFNFSFIVSADEYYSQSDIKEVFDIISSLELSIDMNNVQHEISKLLNDTSYNREFIPVAEANAIIKSNLNTLLNNDKITDSKLLYSIIEDKNYLQVAMTTPVRKYPLVIFKKYNSIDTKSSIYNISSVIMTYTASNYDSYVINFSYSFSGSSMIKSVNFDVINEEISSLFINGEYYK